jgi:hypothetical protein
MQNNSGWMQAGTDIHAGVGTMRAPSRRWVMACAWLIRRIVMHAPGFAGAIACAMVYVEVEAAAERYVSKATGAV